MKTRIMALVLVFVLLITLTGCWDYTEFEDFVQLFSMGFDYNKDTKMVTVTSQYLLTTGSTIKGKVQASSGSIQSTQGATHSAEAESVVEAISKLQQATVKRMFPGYIEIFVVGEDAAKFIMKDILEFVDRNPLIRVSGYFVVTQGLAKDTISTYDKSFSISSSLEILNLLRSANEKGYAFTPTVHELLDSTVKQGSEIAIPKIISVWPPKDKKDGSSKEENGGQDESEIQKDGRSFDVEKPGDQYILGNAVFRGSSLVGYLNDKESIGLSLIKDKGLNSLIAVNIDKEGDKSNKLFFRITRSESKTKIKLDTNKEMPEVHLNITIRAVLLKYDTKQGEVILNKDRINEMQEALEKEVESYVNAAVLKGMKEYKTDIFGFGYDLYRYHPNIWNKYYKDTWNDILPKIPVSVKINVKVINTGSTLINLFEN